MKKKISIVVMSLALVLGLAGCGNSKTVEYDPTAIEESCEQVLAIIQSGGITDEQVKNLSDWNQGYLMTQFESQTGVRMEADAFITALEGWQAAYDECGEYVSHGDYRFKNSSKGVTATAEAEFSGREAELEFVFDEKLELDSFTVNAHFTTGEILKKAGLNTLLGMGTVFVVLIFMSFVISLLKYIPAFVDGTSRKKKSASEASAEAVPEAPEATAAEEELDDTELIAVIAAAIAAAEGTSTDGFVVRSIKRRKSNKWNA